MTLPSSQSRQRPACEECRRRKLRCDGKKPQCSICEHAGTECDINTNRVPRGPKKGYLTALHSKIATLESRLYAQEQGQLRWLDTYSLDNAHAMLSSNPALRPLASTELGNPQMEQNLIAPSTLGSPIPPTEGWFNTYLDMNPLSATPLILPEHRITTSTSGVGSSGIEITDIVQAELEQIYFDRVHAAIPILHQRRYLSWSKSPVKTNSQCCLQHAVWATAALMSSQFQYLQDLLYPELKRSLASTSLPPTQSGQQLAVDIELPQTWALTAMFEFVKSYHHEACISAGRAFRLVQLMRLHELDRVSSEFTTSPEGGNGTNVLLLEEKRRIFWMTYILEALYSMRSNLPLVVNEYSITTFLPAPDHEFQNGQVRQTGSLSECMVTNSQSIKSPLNECILLIAMSARTLGQAQRYDYKDFQYDYTSLESDLPDWCSWLSHTLSLRLQTLAQDYPSLSDSSDPMLLFANFVAQASVIYLWKEFRSIEEGHDGCSSERGNCSILMSEYQQRAHTAAEQIVELGRSLIDFPFSKIHPLTTIPLFLGIEFLSLYSSDSIEAPLLHNLLNVIRQLKDTSPTHQLYTELLVDR